MERARVAPRARSRAPEGSARRAPLARLYGVSGAGRRARRRPPPERRDARARPPTVIRRWDPLARAHQAFAFGFEVQTDLPPLGPAPDAFGHRGAGGSVHCAWPSLARGRLVRHEPHARRRGRRPARAGAARRGARRPRRPPGASRGDRARAVVWTRRHLDRLVENAATTAPEIGAGAARAARRRHLGPLAGAGE